MWLYFLLLLSVVARVAATSLMEGISGGDFFNFLLITKELVKFSNPFIAKRLPIYPLLLIPGHLLGHPIGWAKILGVGTALGSLVVLYLLGRQLKIKREVLYLALVFTSFQSTLFIYSLRPLTHTLFTFEVLLGLYLFYEIFSFAHGRGLIKKLFLFGLVLGITSMTRHEGFVVAAVLFLCFSVMAKLRLTINGLPCRQAGLRFAAVPFLLVVVPYFVSNHLRFGNPIYTDYLTDPGVNRVTNLSQLLVNFEKVKWVILNLWGETGYFPIKWALIPTVLVLLAFVLLRRNFLLLFLPVFFILNPSFSLLGFVSFFFACVMILGGLKFVLDTKWRGIPLLLVLTTQTILLMFIQPWGRHLQHTFPFWALFLGIGLSWILEGLKGIVKWSAVAVLGGLVLFNCLGGIGAAVESHRLGILPTQPLFEAVAIVKNLEGPIAFESNASWVQYYLGDKAVYFANDLEIPPVDRSFEKSPAEQWAWIEEVGPKYLVRYNLWNGFSLVDDSDFVNRFRRVKSFESVRGDERFTVEVYQVVMTK